MEADEHHPESEGPDQHGEGRKQRPRGLLRARNLLDIAAARFVTNGVEATTVDEIVARAGIAKGTFYHHYKSKSALLAALREDVLARFATHISAALGQCPRQAFTLRLETWVRAFIAGYIDMGPLHDIVFEGPSEPSRWTVTGYGFMNQFVALLTDGMTEGVWSVPDPSLTATLIFCGLHGAVDDLILRGEDLQQAEPKLVALAKRIVIGT